jgi:hypothetical protein
MKDNRLRWIASAALVCGLAGGCANKPPVAATQPTTAPALDTASAAALRVRELSHLRDDYAALAHQLPGSSLDEHRQLMGSVFDKLDEILPLLAGSQGDLVFRQHLMVLEDARGELGGNPPDQTIDPTIDTGLRSAYNALLGIVHGKDFDESQFTASLDDMKVRLDQLDTVQGPTHQVIVAEAVEASSGVIAKAVDALAQRVVVSSADADSTTAPATAPSTQPQ